MKREVDQIGAAARPLCSRPPVSGPDRRMWVLDRLVER